MHRIIFLLFDYTLARNVCITGSWNVGKRGNDLLRVTLRLGTVVLQRRNARKNHVPLMRVPRKAFRTWQKLPWIQINNLLRLLRNLLLLMFYKIFDYPWWKIYIKVRNGYLILGKILKNEDKDLGKVWMQLRKFIQRTVRNWSSPSLLPHEYYISSYFFPQCPSLFFVFCFIQNSTAIHVKNSIWARGNAP